MTKRHLFQTVKEKMCHSEIDGGGVENLGDKEEEKKVI
jgi:hypothetical protein